MAKAPNTTMSEALGVLLLAAGVLLLLALVSFDPNDVPSWVFFNKVVPSNAHISNFIGIVGVLVAGFLYFLIGAAAYLLAVVLLGFGAGKMFFPKVRFADRIGWIVLFLLCGASLLQLQPWFLQSWPKIFHVEGPGGWFGLWIGARAFENALGFVGASIVLTGFYLASLILVTGFHPIAFVKLCIRRAKESAVARREARRARLDNEALFAENQREIEKGARKLEKKIRPKRELPRDEPVDETPAEPAPSFPAPKIIDASVPPPPRKPTLEELKAAKKKVDAPAMIPGLKGLHLENYEMPSLDLLDPPDTDNRVAADPAELKATQDTIIDTLAQFSIQVSPGDITKGPTITRYELYPAKGVRVDRIVALERDIARATRAERINILAPIPGKDTVGIEIANANKVKVTLRELFESDAWVNSKARLPLALGKDVYGNTIIADLAGMPHCLVAGTTGSGKSVCINAIIASLLFRFTPEELRFIMIDPKVVEMQLYNTLPHLITPVVTEPKKVLLALRWVVDEMETRYRIIAKCGVRNIAAFNARPKPKSQAELDAEAAEKNGEAGEESDGPVEIDLTPESAILDHPDAPDIDAADDEAVNEPEAPIKVPRDIDELVIPDQMPYIVVIIDELADLMQTAPADVESAVARIAQKARAAGIHLIVATQTPRADVVTGIIKANIPSRVAFQVASKIDSRVILDENGAEKLLGQGDMLYLPPGTSKLVRSQGVLVTDAEIGRVVEFVSANAKPQFEPTIHAKLTSNAAPEEEISDEDEELVEKCLEIIKQEGKASTSMLQRRLRLGYTRAARVVDILEARGILGPKDGAKDREILIDLNSLP